MDPHRFRERGAFQSVMDASQSIQLFQQQAPNVPASNKSHPFFPVQTQSYQSSHVMIERFGEVPYHRNPHVVHFVASAQPNLEVYLWKPVK